MSSYCEALRHLVAEGDTDLLPPLFEIAAIRYSWKELLAALRTLDLEQYGWRGGRRFLVPKDAISFRAATQLDPIDSLVLTAIVLRYGRVMERARISVSEERVFSYRFNPTSSGHLYSETSAWHAFWEVSLRKAQVKTEGYIVVADITDYYNQVYHHVLENQLYSCRVAEFAVRALMRLVSQLTDGVSRGIPVGPHAVHLLAECALDPTDRSLLSHGLDFCRFVDDIHIFCSDAQAAGIALHDLARILDDQQRLVLQRHKTRIMRAREFIKLAGEMLVERPLNDVEARVLQVLAKHSHGNPYVPVSLETLSPEELEVVSAENLEHLLDQYLGRDPVDYTRVRWLLRRLAQLGAPGAVDYVLRNIAQLMPALGEVARYITSAGKRYGAGLPRVGELVLDALDHPLIAHSEYMQIVLVDLFARLPGLDHINRLTARYDMSPPAVRREIVVAGAAGGQGHWIRERKAEFASADQWLRRALVRAAPALPGDEARHWVRKITRQMSSLERIVARWAFQDRDTRVGNIRLA